MRADPVRREPIERLRRPSSDRAPRDGSGRTAGALAVAILVAVVAGCGARARSGATASAEGGETATPRETPGPDGLLRDERAFQDAFVARAGARGARAQVIRPFRVMLRRADGVIVVGLDRPYTDCRDRPSRQQCIDELLDRVERRVGTSPRLLSTEEARRALSLRLFSSAAATELARMAGRPIVSRAYARDLAAVVVVRRGASTIPVSPEDLTGWAIDEEEAFRLARADLERGAETLVFDRVELAPGVAVLAVVHREIFNSSFLFLPSVLERMGRQRLGGDVVAIAPSRDVLVLAPAREERAVGALAAYARDEGLRSESAISPLVYRVTADAVTPLDAPAAPAASP